MGRRTVPVLENAFVDCEVVTTNPKQKQTQPGQQTLTTRPLSLLTTRPPADPHPSTPVGPRSPILYTPSLGAARDRFERHIRNDGVRETSTMVPKARRGCATSRGFASSRY